MKPRFDDWPQRMEAAIRARRDLPLDWGVHDCATFASDVIQAMTGEDFFAPFRGRYTTALGAVRAIRRAGFDTLADFAAANAPAVPVAFARRGDLLFYPTGAGGIGSLAIVESNIAYAAGVTRLDRLPAADAVAAYRIGGT